LIFLIPPRVWRDARAEVNDLARRDLYFRLIHQPVTAQPQGVARLRKARHHVTPAIISNHDFDEFSRQVGRFGDYPHTRLRSLLAGYHPTDIVVADADNFCGGLLTLQ